MPVIFGYGSLISRSSAEKTLGRSLCSNDLCCAVIQNHVRSWTAQANVKLLSNDRIRPSDALFLDLTERQGSHCNGVAIKVSEHELYHVHQFWETTMPSEAMVVEGEYIFEDCAQNAAAGQCFSII